jgi:cell division protein FtsI (penicillin-binding protein 3)
MLVMAFVLSLFVGRLVQVQGFHADAYATVAQTERMQKITLPAIRGEITDSSGVPLAQTVEARMVTADPTVIEDPVATAAALAPKLQADPRELYEKLIRPDTRWVLLARDVSPVTWREIREIRIPDGTGKQVPLAGIMSEPQSKRVYPADQVAANLVGFVGRDGHGLAGLEMKYEPLLAGRDGRLVYERDKKGRQIATAGTKRTDPVPGRDLKLTISRDIQWVAQQAIAAQVKSTKAESGSVVVMRKTGEILAMAVAPGFDPNQPGKARREDRGNRALSEHYEPGSIAKIMTIAAAIEEGVATPDTRVTVPGSLERGGKSFGDWWSHGTERLTLTGVLARSSNIGTILVAEQLGSQKLHEYLAKFGLGQPTGLKFPGESRGILAPEQNWSRSQHYTVPFGQGISVNAVQAASFVATIANGGVRVQPRLVDGWTGEDGEFEPAAGSSSTRVVSEDTASRIAQMMEMVTAQVGTAPRAAIPGYRVAGKTGTAERADSSCGCYRGYTASFTGFAPADDPELVVSVTLQKPVNGHTGGALGGPVFKEVMSFALQTLGVPPTGRKSASLPMTW